MTTITSLDLVLFQQGEELYAVEACFAQGQGRLGGEEPLSPLLSLAGLLGQEEQAPSHWLAICTAEQPTWLLGLNMQAELITLPTQFIYTLPDLIYAKRQLKALRAVAWYKDRFISLLDARLLYV